ncbi:MAG: TonB-dependent receptor [Saprospiraceae bacterium]
MRVSFLQTFAFLFFPMLVIGQVDSIVLTADKLLQQDILPAKITETNQKVYAATRSMKELKELPFTIHVITKEEIRDNGYRTLVDALKMAPGIKISQPGNALEGETFQMRGLQGNAYAKILLNGNPIKPSIVRGMPIGAQIPIQQAERIEIIYGASGTLFGADASAGVINIVLEETERPVYSQANLNVGSKEYTNLDISFAGRLGKQEKTLRYSLYGSFTFRGDLKTQHQNDSLFNSQRYFSGRLNYPSLQNYISDGSNDRPLINNLPHQSRLIGINLAYRAMTFSAEAMYRRDHSSIGLNPIAVSYSNPLNYIGERIINLNFALKKDYRRFGFDLRIGYLQYQMDSRSSFNYIYNSPSALLDELSWNEAFDNSTNIFNESLYDSLTENHYQTYFNGTRFSFSETNDFRTDIIFNLFPRRNFDLKTGVLIKGFANVPLVNYSRVPLGSSFFRNNEIPTNIDLTPFYSELGFGVQFNSFAQALWSHKKWTFIGGVNWLRRIEANSQAINGTISDNITSSLDFRFGINYQPNQNWSIRANYGTAIHLPSSYYQANSLRISLQDYFPISVAIIDLEPEEAQNIEIGLRWTPSKQLYFDVVGFYSKYQNLISPFLSTQLDLMGNPIQYTQGYINSESSQLELYGIQSHYLYKSNVLDFIFNLTFSFGEEKTLGLPDQPSISQLPKMIRKTRLVVRPSKRISFTFDTIVNSKSENKIRNDGRGDLPRFRTIDILGNYNINRNFRVFFKIRNIFNREYAGLNAYDTLDDLIYNPQELRNFRLGMSYRVD